MHSYSAKNTIFPCKNSFKSLIMIKLLQTNILIDSMYYLIVTWYEDSRISITE